LIGVGLLLLILFIKRRKKRKNNQLQNNIIVPRGLELTNPTNPTNFNQNRKLLQRSQISFNQIAVEKELGEGSYGKVFLGKWNSAPVALKFCKKKNKIEDFMREIKLMMYVSI
jgi:hypothetical protein